MTLAALVAFAANSVLCRLALQGEAIDPATFTLVRLLSGAVVLLLIVGRRGAGTVRGAGAWTTAAMLALYAVPFAFAYTQLTAGTGALILFGSVQLTMLLAAVRAGDGLHWRQWIGVTLALAGLIYLVLPGLAAPPPAGAALMAVAGIAWGLYSLWGRGSGDPLRDTAGNFLRAVPFVAVVAVAALPTGHARGEGLLLAIASGALASGLGYVAWYAALPALTRVQASVVQLAVPPLAAAGGVVVLAESVSARLVVASLLVLGGIGAASRR